MGKLIFEEFQFLMKTHGRWQPRSSWQFNFAALLKKKKNPVFRSTRAGEKARTVFCFQPAGSQPCFLPTLKRLLGLAASTVFSGKLSSFSWVVLLNHWKSSGHAPVRVLVLFDDFTCSLWVLLLRFCKQKPNPLTASYAHVWSEGGGAVGVGVSSLPALSFQSEPQKNKHYWILLVTPTENFTSGTFAIS